MQNGFIESFNRKVRDECLYQHWFETLEQAKQIIEFRRIEYNTDRPDKALRNRPPEEFGKKQGLTLCAQVP